MENLDNVTLLALVDALVEDAIKKIDMPEVLTGPRGIKGKDGNDFNLEDHAEEISNLIISHIPKTFELSEDQKAELVGPRGRDGKNGEDGKDYDLEVLKEAVTNTILEIRDTLKLKFNDLLEEDIESLRGPRGLKGKDGNDFIFEDNSEAITKIISNTIDQNKDHYKLKFCDLTEEETEGLRGPRGQRGKAGRDFSLDDSKPFIEESLKEIFQANSEDLKLKFINLTDVEKDSLKLKFDDLTFDNKLELKGARGQKGKQGTQGESIVGPRGPIGPVGLRGMQGLPGKDTIAFDGKDGANGKDAPIVEDVKLLDNKDYIALEFNYSDGSSVKTNEIKLPLKSATNIYNSSFASPQSAANVLLSGVVCDPSVYVGSAVYIDNSGTAFNAIATSMATSNVIGIVESKQGSGLCTIRFLGVSGNIYSGLDTTQEYFLSDTVPGAITTAIISSGNIILKLGQPFSSSSFLVLKGTRILKV